AGDRQALERPLNLEKQAQIRVGIILVLDRERVLGHRYGHAVPQRVGSLAVRALIEPLKSVTHLQTSLDCVRAGDIRRVGRVLPSLAGVVSIIANAERGT